VGPTWLKTCSVIAVLSIAAVACGDDDDDTAATETSAASGTTTGATTADTTAAGTGATTAGSGNATASENPGTGEAKDAAEFLDRLAQLYQAALEYTDPVPQVTGDTTQGVTDTTITIGSVTAMTTQQGVEPFAGICEGMMARIGLENSKGGVKTPDGKSRTFEFAGTEDDKGRVCQDDKLDRDLNRQKIKDMVEGDKVFALLPVTSNGFYAGDYLNEKHIPYLGYGFQPDYCGIDKPFAFGVGGGFTCSPLGDKTFVSASAAAPLFEAAGIDPKGTKVALAGSADPSSTVGVQIVGLGYEATGATVVTRDNSLPAPGSPLPTDFTPFVNKLLENSPDVISLIISFDQVEPMSKALKDAGYKGIIQQYVYEDERLAFTASNFPGVDGSYVGSPGVGAPSNTGEGVPEIRAALDAAGFKDQFIGVNVFYGWGAADMLIKMIEQTEGELTTENMVNTANKGWGYEGYGQAVCPTSWPLNHIVGSPCIHIVQLDLTGANGATNSVGANGGKGGLLPKVPITFVDQFITDKPK
jgi:branched-chain amino acid transport system substrate-binding protein